MQAKVVSIQRGINAEAQRRREILAQAELLCWQAPSLIAECPPPAKVISPFSPLRLCASALNFHCIITTKISDHPALSPALSPEERGNVVSRLVSLQVVIAIPGFCGKTLRSGVLHYFLIPFLVCNRTLNIGRRVPPHPGPLPWGEGASQTVIG